jgi:hypothetical protein
MDDDRDKAIQTLCAILTILLTIGNTLLQGVVFRFYWNEFFVLIGFPAISYGLAVGLIFGVGILRMRLVGSNSDKDMVKAFTDCLKATGAILLSWGIGAIVAACI